MADDVVDDPRPASHRTERRTSPSGRAAMEAAIEAEVGRRLQEILREKALDQQLEEINRRLERANHLKEEMVTKDDFHVFRLELDRKLSGFVTVQDLGDGDFVVKHRLVLLDPADQATLADRIERDQAGAVTQRVEDAAGRSRQIRLGPVLGAAGVAIAGASFLLDFLAHILHWGG